MTTRRTTIDDLSALGHELSEEHLALAGVSGGTERRNYWFGNSGAQGTDMFVIVSSDDGQYLWSGYQPNVS